MSNGANVGTWTLIFESRDKFCKLLSTFHCINFSCSIRRKRIPAESDERNCIIVVIQRHYQSIKFLSSFGLVPIITMNVYGNFFWTTPTEFTNGEISQFYWVKHKGIIVTNVIACGCNV